MEILLQEYELFEAIQDYLVAKKNLTMGNTSAILINHVTPENGLTVLVVDVEDSGTNESQRIS